MMGLPKVEEHKGIIPRLVESIFQGIEDADEGIEFTVKLSYVEIYNERVRNTQHAYTHTHIQRGMATHPQCVSHTTLARRKHAACMRCCPSCTACLGTVAHSLSCLLVYCCVV